MKKLLTYLGIAAILGGLVHVARAANTCTNSDLACYVTGSSQSPTTRFRIDASGNVSVAGTSTNTGAVTNSAAVTNSSTVTNTGAVTNSSTLTQTGSLILSQQQVTQISSITVITPTSPYLVLSSSGNNITMIGLSPANGPVIATTTATNGQFIVVTSTSNGLAGQVTLSSGTGSALDLGAATRVLANGKQLGLVYNSLISEWVELFFGSN